MVTPHPNAGTAGVGGAGAVARPDHVEEADLVHRHGRLRLRALGKVVDLELPEKRAAVSPKPLALDAESAVVGPERALAVPGHHEVAIPVHRDRRAALVARREGVYLELVALSRARRVEAPALDAVPARIGAARAGALPDHDEVAARIHRHRRGALRVRDLKQAVDLDLAADGHGVRRCREGRPVQPERAQGPRDGGVRGRGGHGVGCARRGGWSVHGDGGAEVAPPRFTREHAPRMAGHRRRRERRHDQQRRQTPSRAPREAGVQRQARAETGNVPDGWFGQVGHRGVLLGRTRRAAPAISGSRRRLDGIVAQAGRQHHARKPQLGGNDRGGLPCAVPHPWKARHALAAGRARPPIATRPPTAAHRAAGPRTRLPASRAR